MKPTHQWKCILVLALLGGGGLTACGGGGGGSGSGVIIEGTLTQGGGSGHAREVSVGALAHGAGETVENVEICALGVCSTTDDLGVWGFLVEPAAAAEEILLSVQGHGIDAATVIPAPPGSNQIFVTLVSESSDDHGSRVYAELVVADGVTIHEDPGSADER